MSVFTGTQDKANINAAKAQVGLIDEAINRYRLDMNQYPQKVEYLWEKPSDSDLSEKWISPYFKPLKDDPWGNPYQYTPEGKHNPNSYDFWSNGPDGKERHGRRHRQLGLLFMMRAGRGKADGGLPGIPQATPAALGHDAI